MPYCSNGEIEAKGWRYRQAFLYVPRILMALSCVCVCVCQFLLDTPVRLESIGTVCCVIASKA